MKEKNPCLQTCLDNTEKENLNPKKEVGGLKQRLVKQEDYSRRENLRFYNIPEDPEETTEAELCSDCKGCFSRAWSTIKHKVPCNSLHREEGNRFWGIDNITGHSGTVPSKTDSSTFCFLHGRRLCLDEQEGTVEKLLFSSLVNLLGSPSRLSTIAWTTPQYL